MEYKVGDKVRIRSWNSMANEFEEDVSEGVRYIPTYCGERRLSFVYPMRAFCGKTMLISEVLFDGNIFRLQECGAFYFNTSMFDPTFQNTNRGESV